MTHPQMPILSQISLPGPSGSEASSASRKVGLSIFPGMNCLMNFFCFSTSSATSYSRLNVGALLLSKSRPSASSAAARSSCSARKAARAADMVAESIVYGQ